MAKACLRVRGEPDHRLHHHLKPARSRSLVAEALADGGLGRLARRTWPDGRSPSLRRILCHLIEEYARHNGHADLLRESVDGLVGE